MKRFTYLLILFFFVQICQAQRFGIKGGLNFSNVRGMNASTNSIKGFQVGPVAEFNLAKVLYLNTGLFYSEKGYQQKNILSEKWNYLEVPFNVAYKLKASKFFNVFVQAGPYVGYAVDMEKDINPAVDFVAGYVIKRKKTDYGAGFGTGVELGPLVAGFNYQFGLMNLNDGSMETAKYKNKVLQVSLAYMFGEQ